MNPSAAELRNLAVAASQRGDFAAAAMHMAECCRIDPGAVESRFQFGSLLAHLGEHRQAVPQFEFVTERSPGFVTGWIFLARSLIAVGRGMSARRPLRRALELNSSDRKLFRELAEAEFAHGFPADALPLWQEILAHSPSDLNATLKLGETLSRLGDLDEAVAHYLAATDRSPASADLWMALGQANEDSGDRDAAEAAYLKALELAPGWTFPLAGLIELRRGKAKPEWTDQAITATKEPQLPDPERALLGFALGKFHDANGRHEAAHTEWLAANNARQRMIGVGAPSTLIGLVDRTIRSFQPGSPSLGIHADIDDERPVFIVGMPRSGTTLTEQIIAAHPRAHGCGELPDIALIARDLSSQLPGNVQWPESAAQLRQPMLNAAAERYLSAAARHAPEHALRLVDKAPLNAFQLGLVAMLLPRSRVIWCRRDPRDIAISVFGENFSLEEKLATSLTGIGHYINQQHRLMRHWQATLPIPILELQYEALVTEPEQQSRRILEFIGLDWDPACLQFHSSSQGVQTPSRWQVKQPVHTRSIGRWRNYAFALEPLMDVLAPETFAAAGLRD